MKFSAFATFGFLKFSGKEPTSQTVYRTLSNNLGTPYAAETGAIGADKYATAMAIARGQAALDRADAQTLVGRTVPELLPAREHEMGVVPPLRAGYDERISLLKARQRISLGAKRSNVSTMLAQALGDRFLCLRITHPSEIVATPSALSANWGSWESPKVPRKLWRSLYPVSFVGTPQWVGYELYPGGAASELFTVGDRVVVDTGNPERFETVTVTEVGYLFGQPLQIFKATFTKPHDIGTPLRAGRLPIWSSNARHYLVVVTPKASIDPEARRIVHEIMRSTVRCTSRWSIVAASTPGTIDEFTIGTGYGLDVTVFDGLTYP